MIEASAVSAAAEESSTNEDWLFVSPDLIIVLDGTTVRTETGCHHGVAWYVEHLGSALRNLAGDNRKPLPSVLAEAISQTASLHPECDLKHRGTPSAAAAVVRSQSGAIEYLTLGDVTIVFDTSIGTQVVCDDRVELTARQERENVNRHPIGSSAKQAALQLMKHAELASRNQPGGYWIAAADPSVSTQALTGVVGISDLRRMAVLSDGAARLVMLFNVVDWSGMLDMLETLGAGNVIRKVRILEDSDPRGIRWPRNKKRDDATVVLVTPS